MRTASEECETLQEMDKKYRTPIVSPLHHANRCPIHSEATVRANYARLARMELMRIKIVDLLHRVDKGEVTYFDTVVETLRCYVQGSYK